MPERIIIADTGPLVAFLLERERRHAWAVEQFKALPAPFITCEPVLAEAFHLLSRTHNGVQRFFELLSRRVLIVDFSVKADIKTLERLMEKYHDLPMSFADACLVRMAESHANSVVLTLDEHFRVYRKHGRQAVPVIMPEG